MRALLDAGEAAEYLHMTRGHVSKLAKRGVIRATRPGRSWMFTEKALNDFLDRRSNQPKRVPAQHSTEGVFARTPRSAGYHQKHVNNQ